MKEDYFIPCHRVRFETPKKVLLDGLWFGPKKPKKVIVFVHGLSSSTFSMSALVNILADNQTAILTFNNRGFEKVSKMRLAGKRMWILVGGAHEVFTDCADDIQGATKYVRRKGVNNVYLAGSSTGCQKSVYWAYKKGRGVRGLILLAPLSDYTMSKDNKKKVRRALKIAKQLVRAGKSHELLPLSVWPQLQDAQRFISLYSGDSQEEIFTYWDPKRNPKTLRSVKLPILVLLAEKDEYADRPAQKIGDWFAEYLKIGDEIVVVPKVGHSFKGAEKKVASIIRRYIST